METLRQDIRFGLRMLARKPGFTIVALLTLALGIGGNTAIFSVVNAVLLQPLPFENSSQLVAVSSAERTNLERIRAVSYPDLQDWREQTRSLEGLAGFVPANFALTGAGEPERINGELITWNYFSLLRVPMLHGRTFLPEEERLPEGEPVAILEHGLWQRRFDADPGIVGKSVELDEQSFTVVGVAPRGFEGSGGGSDVWIHLTVVPEFWKQFVPVRGARWFQVLGRLKPGVSVAQAEVEMQAIAERLREQYPGSNSTVSVRVRPLTEVLVGSLGRPLWILFGAVGFVLLIGCANIANLLLARATSRQKEMAVRAALGANRWRLIRQLLIESVILSVLSGLLGLLLAFWLVDLLQNIPGGVPDYIRAGIDNGVLAFTLGISVLTGVIFGLAPAFHVSKTELQQTLKEGGRNPAGNLSRQHFQRFLVAVELALAVVLLVGAGLLLRSLKELLEVDPGFDPDNVVVIQYDLPDQKYTRDESQVFNRQLVERLQETPGVVSVSLSSDVPLGSAGSLSTYMIREDQSSTVPIESAVRVNFHEVSPHFFQTLGIPILKGRSFTEQDTVGSPFVIVVSESATRGFWPGEEALGKKLRFRRQNQSLTLPLLTVVGIAKDARYRTLIGGNNNDPDVYLPFAQSQAPILANSYVLSVKAHENPESLVPAIVQTVHAFDSDLPVYGITTFEQNLANASAQSRLTVLLLGIIALTALALAAIGIYGVISYSVTQRAHEIGIRMALGAQRREIFRLVVGQGMVLALLGVGVGLAVSFALTRFMESLLFGITATDPATFAGV